MTPAERDYERCELRLRIARAQLLHQIARPDVKLSDLLTFAAHLGDETSADSVKSFRAAQAEQMQAAQAELDRLPGPA